MVVDVLPADRPIEEHKNFAANMATAAILIVSFLSCMCFIVITMAAQQFQTQIVSNTDSKQRTVGQVVFLVDQYNHILRGSQASAANLKANLGKLGKADNDVRAAQLTAAMTRSALKADVSELYSRLMVAPKNISGGFESADFERSLESASDDIFGATKYINERRRAMPADESKAVGKLLDASRSDLRALQTKVDTLDNKIADKNYAEKMAGVSAADSKRWYDRLKKNDSEAQVTDDLESYQGIFFGFPFYFVSLPSIVLTLFLTVLMGVLGALIALTREILFEDTKYKFGVYLFRTALGASVALAVFFFAGAGALTLAQSGNGTGGSVQLSPYLVSFFAIVSGYLSRRVTQWMRETGARIFQVQEEADRWAIDLKIALKQQGADLDAMAHSTGLSTEELALWDARRAAVPYQAQLQIAAYLRTPPYKLFSDIAPPP